MSKAGNFEIDVSQGGYPAWCEIRYAGKALERIHHKELRDLQYAVEKAMREAREALEQPSEDRYRYSNEV